MICIFWLAAQVDILLLVQKLNLLNLNIILVYSREDQLSIFKV